MRDPRDGGRHSRSSAMNKLDTSVEKALLGAFGLNVKRNQTAVNQLKLPALDLTSEHELQQQPQENAFAPLIAS